MKLKSIKKLNVKNKRVLVRVDFNVPIENGVIQDTTRIEASLKTINYLIDNDAKVILMSHLGRPKGKTPELSLKPVAKKLSEFLKKEVKFVEDCIGNEVKKVVDSLKPGDVLLLENLRFYKEEEKNDEGFSKKLAELGDVYVNDAFATAHRAHSSTYGVGVLLKEKAAGFLMEEEIDSLSRLLEDIKRPYTVILGGAKVSTKLPLIKNLIGRADRILLGGGMIFTFYKSQGMKIGDSIVEDDMIDEAKEILKEAANSNVEFLLPVDVLVVDEIKEGGNKKVVQRDEIPDGFKGVDIGENSIRIFHKAMEDSKTIFWNGPMGIFEMDDFAEGSKRIGEKITELTDKGVFTVAGGGDTISCINKFNVKLKHISTGGGASLEFLSGEKLLPIELLKE
uniref:Phosphoglycerate kinase n=1 Tax=candidate division WOR-3 bacterium TaxID=2052148 RepID=A0A7C4YI43_UNCW3